MYRCHFCKIVSRPGARANHVVIKSREKIYPERTYRLRGKEEPSHDPGGRGWEIVKEVKACSVCAVQKEEEEGLTNG